MGNGHKQSFTSREVTEITPPPKTWRTRRTGRGMSLHTLAHAFVCAGDEACRRPTRGRCELTGVTTPPRLSFPARASTRVIQLWLRDLPAASPKPRTLGAACCPLAGPDVALGQLPVGRVSSNALGHGPVPRN